MCWFLRVGDFCTGTETSLTKKDSHTRMQRYGMWYKQVREPVLGLGCFPQVALHYAEWCGWEMVPVSHLFLERNFCESYYSGTSTEKSQLSPPWCAPGIFQCPCYLSQGCLLAFFPRVWQHCQDYSSQVWTFKIPVFKSCWLWELMKIRASFFPANGFRDIFSLCVPLHAPLFWLSPWPWILPSCSTCNLFLPQTTLLHFLPF